jgi:hypothetical protein
LIIFVSIDGIIQFASGKNLFGMTMHGLQAYRISGVFGDELILGSFLTKITLIICGIGFFNSKIKQSLLIIFYKSLCVCTKFLKIYETLLIYQNILDLSI